MPPGTAPIEQQSAVPLGPHVGAEPAQDGLTTHACVVVLQDDAAPLQSASLKQATHCDFVPKSSHFGASAGHAEHVAPQLASPLHTEQTPAPPQRVLLAHAVLVAA